MLRAIRTASFSTYVALAAVTVAMAFTFVGATTASAQETYPSHAIKLVVPYSPGGANDSLARIIGEKLGEKLKQPVVIQNRPGAGGVIGTSAVAKSPPDGYTILIINTLPHTASGALYKQPPYDAVNDFSAVGLMGTTPYVLVVNQASKYQSLGDLIADAKQAPGTISYASAGQGSATHLTTELLRSAAHFDVLHVPYKGGGPAIVDLLGGQVGFTFENVISVLSFIKEGKLRPLAVSSAQESRILPSIPTVASVIKSDYDVKGQFAIVAPRGTPAPIVDTLNKAITEIVTSPDVIETFAKQGIEAKSSTPEELAGILKKEAVTWSKVIKDSGVSLN